MFFDGDSSSGVSGDLESATAVASFMEGYWGMGHTVSSYSTARRLEVGSPGGGRGGPQKGESTETKLRAALADRIEDQLGELLDRAEAILRENRSSVLAIAHALETHKTLTGEDIEAVVEGREGLDGGRPGVPGPGVRRQPRGLPRGRGRGAPRPHVGEARAAGGRAPSPACGGGGRHGGRQPGTVVAVRTAPLIEPVRAKAAFARSTLAEAAFARSGTIAA